MKEYIVWGIPYNESSEQVLYTLSKTLVEANQVVKVLTEKHNVTDARIQIIDLSNDSFNAVQNFIDAIN